MTTDTRAALELRLAISEIYTAVPTPPGAGRANALVVALRREPESRAHQQRARDLLDVLDLRSRLIAHRDHAERLGASNLALVVHGLIGHADAELLGAVGDPGWRAAALDMLDPDGEVVDPLDRATARRLFALAMCVDVGDGKQDGSSDDAAGE